MNFRIRKMVWYHCRVYASVYIFFKKLRFVLFFLLLWEDNCFTHCVGFCHASARISHKYTYVPSFLNPPPTSYPAPPLSLVTELSSLGTQQIPTCYHVYVSMLLSQVVLPSPSPTVSTGLFSYVCVCIAALQIGSSVQSF